MSEAQKKRLSDIYANVEKEAEKIPVREMGEIGEGIIKDIKIGVIKDFIDEESLTKWRGKTDADCMQLTIVTPDNTELNQVMTFSPHPQSNLSKWKRRYGKYPEINDKVSFRHDGNFWKLN